MIEVRCPVCGRKLAEINGQVCIKCSKCKNIIEIDTRIKKVNIRASKSAN